MINYILHLSFIICALIVLFDKALSQEDSPFKDGKLELDYDGKKCVAQLAPIDETKWERVARVIYDGDKYPLYCPRDPMKKATCGSPNEADKGTVEGDSKEGVTGSVEGENEVEASKDVREDVTNTLNDDARKDEL